MPGGIGHEMAKPVGCPRCGARTVTAVGDDKEAQRRLARAIKEAMEAAELTPPKLAAKLDVAPKTVNRWVNGEAVPSALSIRPLADALGVSPMLFVDPPPVPEYPLAEYLVRQATQEGVEEGLQRAGDRRQPRRAS